MYYYGYNIPMQYQRAITPTQEAPNASNTQPAAPTYTMPLVQQNLIKGRPVVSIDEARASQIDLDGSLYVFPDLGNKKIYTKQINMDGTATFNIFELAPQAPQSVESQPEYITRPQLDEILAQFKESLTPPKAPKPTTAPQTFNL